MSRIDDIKAIIALRQRRLQKLKEHRALLGSSTDPATLIEIEDIENEIKGLQIELQILSGPKRCVQIFLEGDFPISDEHKIAAIETFAILMKVERQAIEIRRIYKGSIVFDLSVPSIGIHNFQLLLETNSSKLHLLKIKKIILEQELGEAEEWVFRKGRFILRENSPSMFVLPSIGEVLSGIGAGLVQMEVLVDGKLSELILPSSPDSSDKKIQKVNARQETIFRGIRDLIGDAPTVLKNTLDVAIDALEEGRLGEAANEIRKAGNILNNNNNYQLENWRGELAAVRALFYFYGGDEKKMYKNIIMAQRLEPKNKRLKEVVDQIRAGRK